MCKTFTVAPTVGLRQPFKMRRGRKPHAAGRAMHSVIALRRGPRRSHRYTRLSGLTDHALRCVRAVRGLQVRYFEMLTTVTRHDHDQR